MKTTADVDIDLADRNEALTHISHIPASRRDKDGTLKLHNTGIYVTDIPLNPVAMASNIEFREAEQRGYFKLDFLNMNVYSRIENREHLKELERREPDWSQCWREQDFCEKIVHIGGHWDKINRLRPDTVPRMAMFLAVIRPAKIHLLHYDWATIGKSIWKKPTDGSYAFKKSHAVSYSLLVKVNINLEQTAT